MPWKVPDFPVTLPASLFPTVPAASAAEPATPCGALSDAQPKLSFDRLLVPNVTPPLAEVPPDSSSMLFAGVAPAGLAHGEPPFLTCQPEEGMSAVLSQRSPEADELLPDGAGTSLPAVPPAMVAELPGTPVGEAGTPAKSAGESGSTRARRVRSSENARATPSSRTTAAVESAAPAIVPAAISAPAPSGISPCPPLSPVDNSEAGASTDGVSAQPVGGCPNQSSRVVDEPMTSVQAEASSCQADLSGSRLTVRGAGDNRAQPVSAQPSPALPAAATAGVATSTPPSRPVLAARTMQPAGGTEFTAPSVTNLPGANSTVPPAEAAPEDARHAAANDAPAASVTPTWNPSTPSIFSGETLPRLPAATLPVPSTFATVTVSPAMQAVVAPSGSVVPAAPATAPADAAIEGPSVRAMLTTSPAANRQIPPPLGAAPAPAAVEENIAAPLETVGPTGEKSFSEKLEKTENVYKGVETDQTTNAGIGSAKRPRNMIADISNSVESAAPTTSVPGEAQLPRPANVTPHDVAQAVRSTPVTRAFEAIHQITERQQTAANRVVDIQVATEPGAELSVRLAYRGGVVHTEFRTNSPELRAQLSREWQSSMSSLAAGAPSVRLAEPTFTSIAPNGRGEGMNLGGQSSQQQSPQNPAQASFSTGGLRPASVSTTMAASSSDSVAAPRTVPSETSRRLHTFA